MSMLKPSPTSSLGFRGQSFFHRNNNISNSSSAATAGQSSDSLRGTDTSNTSSSTQGRSSGDDLSGFRSTDAASISSDSASRPAAVAAPSQFASIGHSGTPTSSSPIARPKRSRASPEPEPSLHPTHRESASPSISAVPSASSSRPPIPVAQPSTQRTITSVAVTAATAASEQTPQFVNTGTQYTPPDYPPTSLRSSQHPANRTAAARLAAASLLQQGSSAGASYTNTSSNTFNTTGFSSHSSSTHPPGPFAFSPFGSVPGASVATTLGRDAAPPFYSHPDSSLSTTRPVRGSGVVLAGEHSSATRASRPAAGVAVDSPLPDDPAEPRLRVTPQSSLRNAAHSRDTASATGTSTTFCASENPAAISEGHVFSSSSAATVATARPTARDPSVSTGAGAALRSVSTAGTGGTRAGSAQAGTAENQGSSSNRSSSSSTHNDGATTHDRPQNQQTHVLPADYSRCDANVLARLIADMLMELIEFNDQIPLQDGHLTRFHSRAPPGISVHDYLARLTFHATLSPPILLSMVFLIDRLCLLYSTFTINSLTVHRFLITAATVASKGLSDSFWTNHTYARCGGVSVRELAMLEIELLSRVSWRIVPRPESLVDYYINLVARNPLYEIEQPQEKSGAGDASDRSDEEAMEVDPPNDADDH